MTKRVYGPYRNSFAYMAVDYLKQAGVGRMSLTRLARACYIPQFEMRHFLRACVRSGFLVEIQDSLDGEFFYAITSLGWNVIKYGPQEREQ